MEKYYTSEREYGQHEREYEALLDKIHQDQPQERMLD